MNNESIFVEMSTWESNLGSAKIVWPVAEHVTAASSAQNRRIGSPQHIDGYGLLMVMGCYGLMGC